MLLEVEVSELITLLEVEELAKSSISIDGVLVLQTLLLHVVSHELGDIGTRLLGTRRTTHESAELRTDVHRDLEDGRTSRLALLALGNSLATTTLVSNLLELGGLLLELLGLSDELRESLAHRKETGSHRLNLGLETNLLSNRGGNSRSSGGNRGRSGNSRGSLSLSSLGLGSLHRLCLGDRSRGSSGNRGLIGLLGYTLGGLGGSRHYTGSGG
jgi:hypothetical protein